jgi:hypothetical protein
LKIRFPNYWFHSTKYLPKDLTVIILYRDWPPILGFKQNTFTLLLWVGNKPKNGLQAQNTSLKGNTANDCTSLQSKPRDYSSNLFDASSITFDGEKSWRIYNSTNISGKMIADKTKANSHSLLGNWSRKKNLIKPVTVEIKKIFRFKASMSLSSIRAKK